MIKALSSSLSLRLLGIFAITAALVIFILISLFSRGLSGQWARSIRPHLAQYVQYVQQDLGTPPQPDRALAIARRLPVDIHIFQNDELIYATTSFDLEIDSLQFEAVGRRGPRQWSGTENTSIDKSQRDQSTFNPLPGASVSRNKSRHRVLRVEDGEYTVYYDLRDTRPKRRKMRTLTDELLVALGAIGLVLGGSYLLIRQQLSPIRRIQKSVGIMTDGQLEHRIDSKGRDDLADLSNSIDSMATRLQAMLDAKRQLLLALSHELR